MKIFKLFTLTELNKKKFENKMLIYPRGYNNK